MVDVVRADFRAVEAGADALRTIMPNARLGSVDASRFRFVWTSAAIDGVTVIAHDMHGRMVSEVEDPSQIVVARIAGPTAWARTGGTDIRPEQPFIASAEDTSAGWAETARVRAFIIDHAAAESLARQVSGDDRLKLRVTGSAPVDPALAAYWSSVHEHARRSLLDIPGLDSPIVERQLRRLVLETTLAAFPTTFLDAMRRRGQARSAPATVRRAMAYIDAHAHEPVTVDEIAVAARMSTRGLQAAFKRATGLTPMQYLRRARLAGARAELLAADPASGASVEAIARKWGFAHQSRFSRAFQAEYGETPRSVLAR